MRKITTQMLQDKGASCRQVQDFKQLFPNGARVTKANCLKVVRARLDYRWFFSFFFPPTAAAEFNTALEPSLTEFNKAQAIARAKFNNTQLISWVKFNTASERAWEQLYKAITITIFNIMKKYWE